MNSRRLSVGWWPSLA